MSDPEELESEADYERAIEALEDARDRGRCDCERCRPVKRASHEPECYNSKPQQFAKPCICDRVRAAFRRGYNAHAMAAEHWKATHGAYPQHGPGENP